MKNLSQYKLILKSNPLPAIIHDTLGNIIHANNEFTKKYSSTDNLLNIVQPDSRSQLSNWLKNLGKTSDEMLKISLNSDAGKVYADLHTNCLKDINKHHFLTVFQDVSEFIHAQNETTRQEQKLEIALEAMNAGIWEWNIKDGSVSLDGRMNEIIGYSNDDLQPLDVDTWYKYVHPEDAAGTHQVLLDHLQGKRSSFDHVFRMHHKQGHYVWVHGRAKVNEWDEEGNPARLIGTHVNFQEWKNIESKLLEEKNLLKSLIDAIPDSIYFKDEKLRYILVNEAKAGQHHRKPDDLTGKTDFDVFPESIAQFSKKDDDYILNTGQTISGKEEKLEMFDGSTKWVLITKLPRLNHEGEIIGVMGISRNITQRKAEEERRKLQLGHYRDILSTVSEGVMIFDENQNIVYGNDIIHEMLGYAQGELIGTRVSSLMTDNSLKKAKAALKNRKPGQSSSTVLDIRKKTGEIFTAQTESKSLYSFDGSFEGSCTIITSDKHEPTHQSPLHDHFAEIDNEKPHKTICASCKKVEFGDKDWDSIERYIHQMYDEIFSHGICPDCLAKLSMEFTAAQQPGSKKDRH